MKTENPRKGIRRIFSARGARKWLLLAVGVVLFLLLLMGSVAVYADARQRGKMFPSTRVLGMDVSGMPREEVVALLQEKVVTPLRKPVTLKYGEKRWEIDPAELKLNVDLEALVDRAYRMGWERSLWERVYRRFFARPAVVEVGLEYTIDEGALRSKLSSIAREIDRSPRNASLDFDFKTGKLSYTWARDGLKMDQEATLRKVMDALLSEERVVDAEVATVAPSVTDDRFKSVIVVDVMGFNLKLYNKDTLVKTYPVAVGTPKYPTPLGSYKIIRKEKNPVWINPNSDWSKDMPPRIEPGPNNPLGLRALVTNAGGGLVLIHGSPNFAPGMRSHGCIRMSNANIVELFDLVEVGTPVYIWTSKPIPPPPPEQGPVEGPENPGLADDQG
ncbi:MAG: L,D-transpeptidase/peptidoglycan binding protein [Candidatus Geothermincolales bacterium]